MAVHFHGNMNRFWSTICRRESVFCRLGIVRRVLMWGASTRPENLHFQLNSGVLQCQKRVENEDFFGLSNAPAVFVASARPTCKSCR